MRKHWLSLEKERERNFSSLLEELTFQVEIYIHYQSHSLSSSKPKHYSKLYVFTKFPQGKYGYYPHLSDVETDAQRGEVAHRRPHSYEESGWYSIENSWLSELVILRALASPGLSRHRAPHHWPRLCANKQLGLGNWENAEDTEEKRIFIEPLCVPSSFHELVLQCFQIFLFRWGRKFREI